MERGSLTSKELPSLLAGPRTEEECDDGIGVFILLTAGASLVTLAGVGLFVWFVVIP